MPQYIVLVNWTEQGVRDAKDSLQRRQKIEELATELGATLHAAYWTMGRYDVIARFEAPDDLTMSAIALKLGGMGVARTETLRAFDEDEMAGIIGKLG